MATFAEMSAEIETLKQTLKDSKVRKQELVVEYKKMAADEKATRDRIQLLSVQIRAARTQEKVAQKEEKLRALIAAKEAASALERPASRRTVDNSMPEEVAAHRTKPDIDPLAGSLDEPVNMDDLKSDLDIF